MPAPESAAQVFDKLRILAAEDPRTARAIFWDLLDSNSPSLDTILQSSGRPGEGRLRQLIANAVRNRPDKQRLLPTLLRWLGTETDEFARRAIEAAVEGVDTREYQPRHVSGIFDRHFVTAYRYAAGRLKHEIRNALLDPRAELLRLKTRVEAIPDLVLRTELAAFIGQLEDAFRRFGRTVDFEPEDEHFQFRKIELPVWIETMNTEYANRYSPIRVSWIPHAFNYRMVVWANDYFLRLIFWNQWINAHQSVPNNCAIVINHQRVADRVDLIVSDNGPGFPAHFGDLAFHVQYSAAGNGRRGQGLLEIQDAVEHLQGTAQLVTFGSDEYRLKIQLPLVAR